MNSSRRIDGSTVGRRCAASLAWSRVATTNGSSSHCRRRRWAVGKPSVLIPNILPRQFTVTRPNKAWLHAWMSKRVVWLKPRRVTEVEVLSDGRNVDWRYACRKVREGRRLESPQRTRLPGQDSVLRHAAAHSSCRATAGAPVPGRSKSRSVSFLSFVVADGSLPLVPVQARLRLGV